MSENLGRGGGGGRGLWRGGFGSRGGGKAGLWRDKSRGGSVGIRGGPPARFFPPFFLLLLQDALAVELELLIFGLQYVLVFF